MSTRDYDADDMPAHGASAKAPDGQPSNPIGGQHPSDHRRREREAQPIPVHHHEPERTVEEHMSETAREHAARKAAHERR